MGTDRLDWDEDEVTSEADEPRKSSGSLRRATVLRLAGGPGAPQDFVLTGERYLVGRAADADIRIFSTSISRHHMLIQRSGPEYTVRDLDSRNGVFLNGIRVHSAVLRAGDQIQIGESLLLFEASLR